MGRAFVFGASGGLGSHLASRLAEEGWAVTGTGRRAPTNVELPQAVRYLQADLRENADIQELAAHLLKIDPDLVVHSAVSYGDHTHHVQRQIDDLAFTFRVNAMAPYVLIRDHLHAMPPERACSYVIVNSDSIHHANETSAEYAASKAALRVLTAGLASACRDRQSSVSTLSLGPLADPRKINEILAISARRQIPPEELVRSFLARSNPSLVITELIDLECCFQSVQHIVSLGRTANGMELRLDGGSSGSLG